MKLRRYCDFTSIEDTFSSDTAVNLDQTDPVAEADFHMAYGLYDQAADLINGALEIDPTDSKLLSKLCEVYFVWGNREAFVDAAGRLQSSLGEQPGSEWDKIVIMGQQIAADDVMFADTDLTAATQAVDLSFETDSDEAGALDMDFGSSDEDSSTSDSVIIDLGADVEGRFGGLGDAAADDDPELTIEIRPNTMETVEMPSVAETRLGNCQLMAAAMRTRQRRQKSISTIWISTLISSRQPSSRPSMISMVSTISMKAIFLVKPACRDHWTIWML